MFGHFLTLKPAVLDLLQLTAVWFSVNLNFVTFEPLIGLNAWQLYRDQFSFYLQIALKIAIVRTGIAIKA